MNEPSASSPEQEQVVVDVGRSSLSDLWKKEDYWAIWLGVIILIVGLFIFMPRPPANMNDDFAKYNATFKAEAARAPFKTIAWYEATAAAGYTDAGLNDKARAYVMFYLVFPEITARI